MFISVHALTFFLNDMEKWFIKAAANIFSEAFTPPFVVFFLPSCFFSLLSEWGLFPPGGMSKSGQCWDNLFVWSSLVIHMKVFGFSIPNLWTLEMICEPMLQLSRFWVARWKEWSIYECTKRNQMVPCQAKWNAKKSDMYIDAQKGSSDVYFILVLLLTTLIHPTPMTFLRCFNACFCFLSRHKLEKTQH